MKKTYFSSFIGLMGAIRTIALTAVIMVAEAIKTAFLFVYQPVARMLDVRRNNEMTWRSYRPVRYVSKTIRNLHKAQGRKYCWQAGVGA